MTTNNAKDPSNLPDGELKENVNNASHVQPDSTIDVTGAVNAKTGGQLNGGITASSGNRMQAANEEGTENI
jgi:hypothetical protein